jgi:hypothetical protein
MTSIDLRREKDCLLLADIRQWIDLTVLREPVSQAGLQQLAMTAPTAKVRKAALYEMAVCWTHEPETLQTLRGQALCGDKSVRELAFCLIARLWRNEPGTLLFLAEQFEAVHADSSLRVLEQVRVARAISRELLRGWRHDGDLLTFFQERAVASPNSNARQFALNTIAAEWPDDAATRQLLGARACDDEAYHNRLQAVMKLLNLQDRDPSIALFVRERCLIDPSLKLCDDLKEILGVVVELPHWTTRPN